MTQIKNKPGDYITLKEVSDFYQIPKVTVNYYVLRGLLTPEFMIGKTNLYDRKKALRVVGEILKTKGGPLSIAKKKLKIL